MIEKPKRIENREYLDFVKSKPCVVWWTKLCKGPIDPSHIKTRGARHSDYEIVAKCRHHHTLYGNKGMAWFEKTYLINLYEEAAKLLTEWIESGRAK